MSTHLPTVLIVGGFPLLRHGIALALDAIPWIDVCGQTGESSNARELCERRRPDLIVLDIDLPDGVGLSLLKDFSRLHPGTRILALGAQEDAEWLGRLFRAGASGYLSKWDSESELANGLMFLVRTEERFVSQRISRIVMQQFKGGEIGLPAARKRSALSARELEVFRLIGRGKGASATARSLGVSVKTIETHHSRIKEKLGLRTAEDLRRAAAAGLVGNGEPGKKARP